MARKLFVVMAIVFLAPYSPVLQILTTLGIIIVSLVAQVGVGGCGCAWEWV